MFTGLVEQTGSIAHLAKRADGLQLQIRTDLSASLGDSIAVNGCCLTVEALVDSALGFGWSFFLSYETLAKTTFSDAKPLENVNLERSLRFGDRLHGHLVSGHIDHLGQVVGFRRTSTHADLSIRVPRESLKFAIPKGSICINGVSLTINTIEPSVNSADIGIVLIPKTLEATNLGSIVVGQFVNVELDLIGKHLFHQSRH